MTTETKLGLLLGMGVIILVGIFISDHLSKANSQQPAPFADHMRAGPIDEADLPPALEEARQGSGGDLFVNSAEAEEPIPLPEDFDNTPEPPSQNATRQQRTTQQQQQDSGPQLAEREESQRDPRIMVQDIQLAQIRSDSGRTVIDGDEPVDDSSTADADDDLPEGFERVEEERQVRFDPDDVRREREQERARAEAEAEQRRRQQEQAARPVIHNVREGETLSEISEQYYGTSKHYKAIFEANRDSLPSENFVRPGVRLVIPERAGDTERQVADSSAQRERSTSSTTQNYTVREKDTLSSIAGRFLGSSTKWRELYELNKDRIENPDRLKPGTEIRVPGR